MYIHITRTYSASDMTTESLPFFPSVKSSSTLRSFQASGESRAAPEPLEPFLADGTTGASLWGIVGSKLGGKNGTI